MTKAADIDCLKDLPIDAVAGIVKCLRESSPKAIPHQERVQIKKPETLKTRSSLVRRIWQLRVLLVVVLGLILADRMMAQTPTNLHNFNDNDGDNPNGLALLDNTLYGTTYAGGSSSNGTIFAINTNGLDFTNIHNFTALVPVQMQSFPIPAYIYTNSDGANPVGGVTASGNTLYGTTAKGGSSGMGTVFAVNTDGTGFTNLHSFTGTNDGANPAGTLILSGNTLFGTAYGGGSSGNGTVFAVNTDGGGFTNLHSFTALSTPIFAVTNSDGANPVGGVTASGNTLYGTASRGGSLGGGTVFAVNTDGTGFTNLHSFKGANDGGAPAASLILSGNILYGTTQGGGSGGNGTLFAVNTNGTAFTNLYSFTADFTGFNPNSDGATPLGGLILSGNTLYGTASDGGNPGVGTVFAINPNGTGFTVVYRFTGGTGYSLRIPMISDTCSNPYRTLFRGCRTVVGAKRRSE